MHRTANGKTIDMNALRTKNEHVRAVGNMNVNARGDIIDSENRVINDNNKRMNAMYNKTTANPPVHRQSQSSQPVIQQQNFIAQPAVVDAPTHIPDDFDNDVVIKK
jgi:23S rRNA A1618 N6-methylase RlmF